MTITLDNLRLRAAIAALHLPRPEDGLLHLFGVRGASPQLLEGQVAFGLNLPGVYNDTLGVFGAEYLQCLGTTDPGSYYTTRPQHPGGVAYLVGCRCYAYKRGLHKGRAALVQVGPVLVRRDRDRDGRPEDTEPAEEGWFGINIHPGGWSRRSVGRWSAGCQVLPLSEWERFWRIIEAHPQPVYRYYLLDRRAFL